MENRLKEIFTAIGFKWREEGQPLSNEKLKMLGISSNRLKDLIENRSNKRPIQFNEMAAIATWLGIEPHHLLKSDLTPIEQLEILVDLKYSA